MLRTTLRALAAILIVAMPALAPRGAAGRRHSLHAPVPGAAHALRRGGSRRSHAERRVDISHPAGLVARRDRLTRLDVTLGADAGRPWRVEFGPTRRPTEGPCPVVGAIAEIHKSSWSGQPNAPGFPSTWGMLTLPSPSRSGDRRLHRYRAAGDRRSGGGGPPDRLGRHRGRRHRHHRGHRRRRASGRTDMGARAARSPSSCSANRPRARRRATSPTRASPTTRRRCMWRCAPSTAEPERIVGILTRRDQRSPSDWIRIVVDSYFDKRRRTSSGQPCRRQDATAITSTTARATTAGTRCGTCRCEGRRRLARRVPDSVLAAALQQPRRRPGGVRGDSRSRPPDRDLHLAAAVAQRQRLRVAVRRDARHAGWPAPRRGSS